MSHSHPAGLLATYNSLTDKHLAGYFNNTRIRRHLLRSGLITRSGRILSEKEYKVNTMKQDHKKYIRECLAQAIFHKVLDMERDHQLEIKRKLDTLARKERTQRLKGEHTRRFIEDNMPILTPHPPAGRKTNRGCSILAEEGRSSPLTLTAPRPYTAPGNMQPPIRLQPLLSNRSTRNVSKTTSGSKPRTSLLESEAPFPIGGKKAMMKFRNYMDNSQRPDTYQLPDINSYLTPIPPTPQPQAGKISRENRSEPWRRKRLRPITAPNGLEPLFTRDPGRIYKTAPHSNAVITMVYFGKNVHLSYEDTDFRDEIKIYQQHCGGENLCVYKGKLLEKDTFQFISKRHHGFPFSLTFFLNGIQVNRLSSCCEFKHRKSSRLGGKRGYFGIVSVEKASPCYRCIIAMGLDRKPSPTKPRKEKTAEQKEEPLKRSQGKLRKERENTPSRRSKMEGKETLVSTTFSAEEIKSGIGEVRTAMEEMEWKGESGRDVWEEDQENAFKYDYEEDFEVDEEKQDERAEDEGQAEDQMSVTSKSPTEGEKDNLSLEKEEAPDVHNRDNCEDDGCSDSEEEDRQDTKTLSSISSRSHLYSSDSEDESTELCAEDHSGNSTGGSSTNSSSHDLQENDDQRKFHFPVEESLEAEIEEQEMTKVDVDSGSPLTEVRYTHDTEEEPTEGTQEIIEAKTSRQSVSPEAKAKSHFQVGGTTVVEDRKAGLPGLEEEVGQVTGEAQSPEHYRSHTAAGLSTTEDGVTSTRKLEVSLGRVVEERAAISSDEQPEQAAQEVCTLEKETAMEEDECFQSEDADTNAGLREKAGMEENEAHHPQDADTNAGLREKAGMEENEAHHPQDADTNAGLREKAGMEENEAHHPQDADTNAGLREKAGMEENEAHHPQDADTNAGLREKAGMEENEAHHPQDADTNAGRREKAAIAEIPLGKKSPTEEQPALSEQSIEKGERPLSTTSEAETDTEGSRRSGEEQLSPTGKIAVGSLAFLNVEQALESQRTVDPDRQPLLQTVMEKGRAVSRREPVLERAVLTESSEFHSETPGESAVLKESGTPEVEEAESEVGSPGPDGNQSKEGFLTELEDMEPLEDTALEREDGFEEEILGGEKAATEGKEVLQAQALPSSSAGEEGASPREVVQGNPEELCRADAPREGVVADTESILEQDPTVVLPGEFTVAGGRKKVERPPTPPRETGSEREEVAGVNVLKTEEKLEGQKVKGEEEGTVEGVSSVEGAHASPNKMEVDPEEINPTGATELSEDTRLLEDSPKERTIALFEAKLPFGKLLEDKEATATEHKKGGELPGQESGAPLQQGRWPGHDGKGLLGAPGSEPVGKARVPESVFTARGQECTAKELDSLEGPERLDVEGPLQMRRRDIVMICGNLPEEKLTAAEVFSGEAEGEKTQEEGGEDRKYPPGTVTDSLAGQDWAVGGGTVNDEEDPHGRGVEETVSEHREVLAESMSTSGDSVTSFADVQKETWSRAGEAPGGTAAEDSMTAEDMTSRTEKVALVEGGAPAEAVETTQEQNPPEV
ncbi:glutamate-rich protein 3 isoform X2 [Onychomys torridus]|uniref:glutamate-rich protein 3 isoform X2 n=1 Tax=Onychomys torridus TaxID=38674 RepID=UPI00167F782A|nr:glutamate-rich protein 3 isoform X2 [Onychomys torridus]